MVSLWYDGVGKEALWHGESVTQVSSKVVIEAIAGHKTVNQISAEHGVHPTQVVAWKKQALERLPEVLANSKDNRFHSGY